MLVLQEDNNNPKLPTCIVVTLPSEKCQQCKKLRANNDWQFENITDCPKKKAPKSSILWLPPDDNKSNSSASSNSTSRSRTKAPRAPKAPNRPNKPRTRSQSLIDISREQNIVQHANADDNPQHCQTCPALKHVTSEPNIYQNPRNSLIVPDRREFYGRTVEVGKNSNSKSIFRVRKFLVRWIRVAGKSCG